MRRVGLGCVAIVFVASCGESSSHHPNAESAGTGAQVAGAAGENAVDDRGGASTELGGSSSMLAGEGGAAMEAAGAAGAPELPTEGSVTGSLLSGTEPVSGITIGLAGKTTLTKADGSFTFANVPSSYELVVIWAEAHEAWAYEGMTSRTPSIQFVGPQTDVRSASIQGPISRDVPASNLGQTLIAFVSNTQGVLGTKPLPGSSTLFVFSPMWRGGTAQTGKIVALGTEPGASVDSVSAAAYGEKALGLLDGAAIGGDVATANTAAVSLSSVASTRKLAGNVTAPAGWVLGAAEMDVSVFALKLAAKMPAQYSFDVPVDARLAPAIQVSATKSGKPAGFSSLRHAVPASGNLDFELPVAPLPVTPATGTTGVSLQTTFTWTPAPKDVVASVRFHVGDWYIWRVTSQSSTTIPDLSAYGVAFAKGEVGYWLLGGSGPAQSVDEAAALVGVFSGLADSEYIAVGSDDFTFTTAN